MSAVPQATPQGATQGLPQNSQEDKFQNLFEAGAFEPTEPRVAQENPDEKRQRLAEAAPVEDQADTEQDAAPTWASLDDYLQEAKLDPQAFQALPVRVKIDGEEKAVPLAEVIKSFQLQGHVNNKSIELSNAQKQFEQERMAAQELYRQQLGQAKTLGDLAQSELLSQFNQINWNQLRQTDPVQWTALQLEFQNRQSAINQHLQTVAAQQEAERQQLQQQQAALLPREREKMLEARPEWRDSAKFDADRKVIADFAKRSGITDAELGTIADHRYMLILHKAAQFDALQASNPAVTKKVREAPQMSRPGTRTSKNPQSAAKQQALEAFLKNPRDVGAQAAAFEFLA